MLGTMTPDQPGVLRRLDGDWFDTGDVVRLTPDGHILIVDRLGRFAKIGGEKVSLDEVECMASELWPQAEHVAVAVPDDRKGERVVLLTTKTAASRGALVEAARKKGLSELNVPSDIRLIEQVPMLGSGKPDLAQAKRIACGSA